MIPGNEQMDKDDFRACLIPASEAATLLRRQHAKFVRLVKKHIKDVKKVQRIVGKDDAHAQGMMDGIECLLAALHQGGNR